MAPTALIEHQLPGRVRLRVPECRGDHAYFERVTRGLSEHPTVSRMRIDARRGSVVIHHTEDHPGQLIAAACDLFEVLEEEPPQLPPSLAENPETVVVLEILAAWWSLLGFYQLTRRDVLGTATENFWNAFRAGQLLNSRAIGIEYAIFGVIQLFRRQVVGSASSLFYNALLAWKLAEAAGGKSRIQFPR